MDTLDECMPCQFTSSLALWKDDYGFCIVQCLCRLFVVQFKGYYTAIKTGILQLILRFQIHKLQIIYSTEPSDIIYLISPTRAEAVWIFYTSLDFESSKLVLPLACEFVLLAILHCGKTRQNLEDIVAGIVLW